MKRCSAVILNLSFSPSKNFWNIAFAGNERRVNVAFAENASSVDVAFAESSTRFVILLAENEQRMPVDIGEGYGGAAYYPQYTGEYEVTPKVVAQSLKTAQKVLKKDVTINAIPYFDVSNPAGGQTIYIGSEV